MILNKITPTSRYYSEYVSFWREFERHPLIFTTAEKNHKN